MKINIVNLSRTVLSVLFVFSGVSKLVSLPFFDSLVAELLIGKDYYDFPEYLKYSQILTRILISLELCLGVAILQNRYLKTVILPLIQFILLIFTVHLFYVSLTDPKGFIEGNCGCFGDILPMNNLESIIKNVIALSLGVIIYLKFKEDKIPSTAPTIIIGLVTLITIWFSIKDYSIKIDPVEKTNSTELVEDFDGISQDSIRMNQIDSLLVLYNFDDAYQISKELNFDRLPEPFKNKVLRLDQIVEIKKNKK